MLLPVDHKEMGDSARTHDSHDENATDDDNALWRHVFEHAPVPTLLITVDTSEAGSSALVTAANHAARTTLTAMPAKQFTPVDLHALFDSTSVDRIIEGAAHFPDSPGTSLDVNVRTLSTSGQSAETECGLMHLQRHGENKFVAQIPPNSQSKEVCEVLAEQRRFRSALLELTELAHTTNEDEAFYKRLLELAVEVVPGAQGGSVQLLIEGTESFRFVAAVGFDLAGLQLRNFDKSEQFRDSWNPEAQIVRDMMRGKSTDQEMTDWLDTYGRVDEIVVNVSAPVVVDGQAVAFVSLDNFEDPNALDQTSVEMTNVISRLIGDLWRRRQLELQLRREREAFRHDALHDSLTALSNRRGLEQHIEHVAEQGERTGSATAMLFVDIDDFKSVNDASGHAAGDDLLRQVADSLSHVVGNAGLVGRWGGDEFMIVPNHTQSLEVLEKLADRIVTHFETLDKSIRLSVGIVWSSDGSATAEELRTAADDALYEAKDAGKGTRRTRVLSKDTLQGSCAA